MLARVHARHRNPTGGQRERLDRNRLVRMLSRDVIKR